MLNDLALLSGNSSKSTFITTYMRPVGHRAVFPPRLHHSFHLVQPVIQRETVQPTTVHQTIPIHEKIDEAPIVHEATTLPTISHDQFLQQQKSNGDAHTHADQGHHHQHCECRGRSEQTFC